jgi:hypothetical protein
VRDDLFNRAIDHPRHLKEGDSSPARPMPRARLSRSESSGTDGATL